MGQRGPAPKPTALRVLQGNPSRRPLNAKEPQPEVLAEAAPPTFLKGRARLAWVELSPLLVKLRVLTEADRMALGLLCDTYGEWLELRADIRKHGRTYKLNTKTGDVMWMPRPEVAMAADAWRRSNLMLQQFGLTPSSRSKVSAAGEEQADLFEEFLRSS